MMNLAILKVIYNGFVPYHLFPSVYIGFPSLYIWQIGIHILLDGITIERADSRL